MSLLTQIKYVFIYMHTSSLDGNRSLMSPNCLCCENILGWINQYEIEIYINVDITQSRKTSSVAIEVIFEKKNAL